MHKQLPEMNINQDLVNEHGVAYLYRVWHELEPDEIAEMLCWDIETVLGCYWRYFERMQSWLSVYNRFPTSEDISEGLFTLEPFDGTHYQRYRESI